MNLRKAVITAAGRDQRRLPLQSLVDRDGRPKSALAIILEEILSGGVEEIAVIVSPGDHSLYREAAGVHAGRLEFIEQAQPLGYGHAIACAAPFTGGDPFALLVSDHLYVSSRTETCFQQLAALASAESCAVSAVQATHESKLPYYGAVGGRLDGGRARIYAVEDVIEKPSPTEAEQRLIVPGLRAGHYLCFFGMHILTPRIMDILHARLAAAGPGEKVPLSAALAELAGHERYLALEIEGRRHDLDVKYGLLMAQTALALAGGDRDEVLAQLVELLAHRRV